jgi:hypothetical protein
MDDVQTGDGPGQADVEALDPTLFSMDDRRGFEEHDAVELQSLCE